MMLDISTVQAFLLVAELQSFTRAAEALGTTAQFTTWLDHEYPSIWRPYFGQSGLTSYYPKNGGLMISQAGSDQVMNTIKAFTADDATVIVGTVIDASCSSVIDLRVRAASKGDWSIGRVVRRR